MKYIDAEKLKTWLDNEADMEFKKTEENANSPVLCHFHNGCRMQALDTIDFITSIQQEQPECIYGRTFKEREKYCKFCSAVCEVRVEQEQPNVDLEKEIKKCKEHYILVREKGFSLDWTDIETTARHFFELGLNAKKEE